MDEQFLDEKGHNMTNCQWMVHEGEVITFNHSDDVFDYGYKKVDRYDINNNGTREICG